MADLALHWRDALAALLFFGGWVGYARAVDNYKNPARPSLLTVMHRIRIRWLTEAQFRTLRMPDVMALNIATSNYTFFASTSILIIAGAFTLLLGGSTWQELLSGVPLVDETSLQLTALKLLTIILVFVYSFFKFTWSIRQVGYCAVVLGSLPNRYDSDHGDAVPSAAQLAAAQKHAETLAPLFTLAGNNFNHGLRAYYFGLAMLPWFVGPFWLLGCGGVMIFILWQREFNSKTLRMLLRTEEEGHLADRSDGGQ